MSWSADSERFVIFASDCSTPAEHHRQGKPIHNWYRALSEILGEKIADL